MGMEQTDILKTTQKERDVMTPTRLSLVLGIQTGTMYKAFKIVGTGTWGVNLPLSVSDVDALILYYAALGNETAIKLAESRVKVTESEKKAPENTVQEIATVTETAKESTETEKKRRVNITLLDFVFLFILLMTGYSVRFFLGNWGIGLWVVYAGALIDALLKAANPKTPKTAENAFVIVCILEILATSVHFSMANLLVVNAAKANLLPFRYEHWGTLSAPFWIAFVLSCVLSGIAIWAVAARLLTTKELSK